MDEDYDLPSIGFSSEKAAAVLVIGALVLLILINRGFRGVNVAGVNLGVK